MGIFYYFNGFSPLIILTRNTITATIRRMWIKLPSTWNAKNPSAQRIIKTTARINIIFKRVSETD